MHISIEFISCCDSVNLEQSACRKEVKKIMSKKLSLLQFINKEFQFSPEECKLLLNDAQLDTDKACVLFLGTNAEFLQFKYHYETKLNLIDLNIKINVYQLMTEDDYNAAILSIITEQYGKNIANAFKQESKSLTEKLEKSRASLQKSSALVFNYLNDNARFCSFFLLPSGLIFVCEDTAAGVFGAQLTILDLNKDDINDLKQAINSHTICDLLFNSTIQQRIFDEKSNIDHLAVQSLAAQFKQQENTQENAPLFFKIDKLSPTFNESVSTYSTYDEIEYEDLFAVKPPSLFDAISHKLAKNKQALESADYLKMAGMFLVAAAKALDLLCYSTCMLVGGCLGLAASVVIAPTPITSIIGVATGIVVGAAAWKLTKTAVANAFSFFNKKEQAESSKSDEDLFCQDLGPLQSML